MKKLLLILVFLCCISTVGYAQDLEITRLTLHIVDVKSGHNISEFPIGFEARHLASGAIEKETIVSDKAGLIMHTLTPGNWHVMVTADNQSTDVIDYYSSINIYIQSNEPELKKKIYLRSVGSVEGVVYDADNNLVSDAEVGFKCTQETDAASNTDNFGAFRSMYLPIGQCTVSAEFEDVVGTTTVLVEKGKLTTISITLDKSKATPDFNWMYFIIVAVIVALVVGFFILYKSRKPKGVIIETNSSSEPSDADEPQIEVSYDVEGNDAETPETMNPRARDVMETLNDKEKKIVEFLVSEGNHSTQATIRSGTGIPKTSLARDFQSLENKKVVEIEKIGKMKKVKLTDWFLGKD